MPLTPLEIHNKEFTTKMRGYDQDEVNEFLDQVIRDYELVMRQNKEIQDELEITNKKLSNFEDMQESLNRSILVAQEAADRLIENTDREVEVIKIEAESYAEKVREEAESYAEKVREEADSYASEEKKKVDNYTSEIEKKADDYAERTYTDADNKADSLLKEAVIKARKVEDETEALRKQGRVFKQRLQLLIESHLELLNEEDWDNFLAGDLIESPIIETIVEVEKELDEKSENVDDSIDETVAIEEEEHYNDVSQESEDYEEGTMPAIELPDSE